MESGERVVQALVEQYHDDLVAAYAAGKAAHPGISMESERFAKRIVGSAPEGPSGVADRLAALRTEDFFLASACELGCAGAWERLWEQYLPRMRAMALRWGAAESEAEEVARDLPGALMARPEHGRVATQLGTYTGSGSLLAWLGTVVDRELSRRRHARAPSLADELDFHIAPDGLPPPDAVVHSETGERVSAALESALLDLSAREFLLVVAKFRDGLSQRDIARQLDISEQRVSVLMTRALDRVREAVRRDVPDETAAQWPARYGLAEVLKSVIARLLDRPPHA